jgi:hypothetical protein
MRDGRFLDPGSIVESVPEIVVEVELRSLHDV